MTAIVLRAIQAAAEYGALAGESAPAQTGGSVTPDRIFERLADADPVVLGVAVLGLLILVGLFRTRRYRS